jgi:hypothetical protein
MGTVCCTDSDKNIAMQMATLMSESSFRDLMERNDFDNRSTHSISIINSSDRSSTLSAFNDLKQENATTVSVVRKDKISANTFVTYIKRENALQVLE